MRNLTKKLEILNEREGADEEDVNESVCGRIRDGADDDDSEESSSSEEEQQPPKKGELNVVSTASAISASMKSQSSSDAQDFDAT